MRFFSKFVFICNICFIVYVILRYAEAAKQVKGSRDSVIPLPWLESSFVVLGWVAILFNFAFLISYILLIMMGKHKILPQWLVIFNFVLLAAQGVYFFTNLIK